MTMTWTLEFSEPLTEKEKNTIIGNLWEHIHSERDADIPGFAKIVHVTLPDGKYRQIPSEALGALVERAFREAGIPFVEPTKPVNPLRD
jgi:hypothetical protein